MDKSEYTKKIHDIIDDTGYKTLKNDPSKKPERTIDSTLKELVRNREFIEELKKRITLQHSYHPQLYGLPKTHKPAVPLRPIVSSIGSATYIPTSQRINQNSEPS